ncbi:hypothetical protein QLQ12_44295 [Actinoplanes sp. NEAU-A12]|uniref:SRPBCC family protein n=1 Tax=Actinoplanes sandaracinus TaxID=3045177 RepID=A0ABT6X0W5_9ACTN|nr:hypothetical protein [Actinoplanes sandaracinus]MDI6105624.1 hypothetical protein [Actinoplanes sandaracinus]
MRGIYVETVIAAPMTAVWAATQDPATHCQWDARFGQIEPVPGATPAQFRYATTVFPGMRIAGHGVHGGQRDRPDGTRTSALRFRCTDRRSLIAAGHGYWRYVPGLHGVRFLTGYTYTPRWGAAGRLIDLMFRPLFGWATAWSFDRLRLWLEHGVTPRRALRNAWRQVALRAATVAILVVLDVGMPLLMFTTFLLLVLPPDRNTPAARRCRRRPCDRLAARAPSLPETL